jgi:hypothetical protein
MSVKINGEEFKIYLQDTLDTIKERYCRDNDTIPKLCYMNIIKQNNISSFESKKIGSVNISMLRENAYDINPLEGAEIEAKSFSQFYLEADIDENDFDRSFNKFVIDALELFPFSSRDEVFFTYIIITNSDPVNEEDYSDSYERAIEQYTELIDKKNEYALYFSFYKKELETLSLKVENNINQSESVKAIVNSVLQEEDDEKYEEPKVIKTHLKLTEYTYNGSFKYSIDIYDFFSKFKTTKICPYIRLGKYHKVYNGVRIIDEEWFEEYLEDNDAVAQMFISGKKQPPSAPFSEREQSDELSNPVLGASISNYYLVQITQLSEDKGVFTFNININVNEQMDLTEDEIFERTISYFSYPLIDLGLRKDFGKGYFVMKGLEVSDELFFDTCLNDEKVNNIIFIDEKYKIQKERGGIRFYVSENNLETSIKCSLVKKVVLKSNEDEAVAFPNIVHARDFITVIQITKGSSMAETLKLITLLENLLYYIQSRQSSFLKYYEKFMTNLKDIDAKYIKKKPKKDKKITLKDIYPQIFISGYARFCQPVAPSVISREEYENDLEEGNDAMIYPRNEEEGPQDYYSCKSDTKYKYVGIKENSLANKDQFRFLPCCFEKDQRNVDKLRYKYENYKEDEDESGFKLLIKSKKILQEKQYGYLPQNIAYTFTISNEDSLTGKSRFLRTGIKKSENSALYCIKKALNLDESTNDMRKSISKVIKNNLASQYGLKPKEVKNILENKLNIDPEIFLEILENVFKVNIILFCRNRISNKEGSMCKPKFKKFFILNPSKKLYDKTVILYKTDGGEFDKLDFPHTELVVLENNVKTEDNVGEITTVFNSRDTFISNLYAMYYSYVETKYMKTNLKNKIIGQVDDGNGKIRILHIKYKNETINILTSPCANFPLTQFLDDEKVVYTTKTTLINPSIVIDFFMDEKINDIRKVIIASKVVGLYAKKEDLEMYVPCDISTSDFSKLPGSTNVREYDRKKELPAPTSLTFSILQQYNSFLKISNSIISYSLFLFSNLFQYEMKNLFLTKDEEEFIKELKAIVVKFDNYIVIENGKNYENLTRELTLENNDIINDKKIVVSSVEIKKKVLYCLYVQMKHNLSALIEYKYKKYVDNFYTSSKDFKTLNEEQNIFYTMKEIRLYMIPIVNPYKINYEIPHDDDFSFYYKNLNIDEEIVFRAIKSTSIEHALSMSKQWARNKSVSIYTENVVDPDSVNFNIYEMEDEYSVKIHNFTGGNDVNIFQILLANIENEIKIYALLPV